MAVGPGEVRPEQAVERRPDSPSAACNGVVWMGELTALALQEQASSHDVLSAHPGLRAVLHSGVDPQVR